MTKRRYFIYFIIIVSAVLLSGCTRPADRGQTEKKIDASSVSQNSNLLSPNKFAESIGTRKIYLNTMENDADIADEKISQAIFKTNLGNFTLKLYRADSPKTVANFIKLVKAGFYDGTRFHRVIKDFMIQGGDPLSKDLSMRSRWGTGNPGYSFDDEFNNHKLVRGSLAMANSGPNSNGSQFFIVTAEATAWLDGKHTNFGEVMSGLDVVLKIGNVKTGPGDQPVEDVIIEKINLK